MGQMMWLCASFFFSFSVQAEVVTVAVIDTGFDLDNESLRPRMKLGETDEEGAIALPGFSGWDFTNNSHVKTSPLQGEVLQEVLLYRNLKAKAHQQGLAPEERAWIERKRSEAGFKDKLKLFKRHSHGTMVTGILLAEGHGIEVFPVKGLGIDVPTLVIEESQTEMSSPIQKHSEAEFRRQVQLSEERVIRKMRKMLAWIHLHNIRVVNASYGVTDKHIRRRFSEWHKEITGLDLDEVKLNEIVEAYFTSLYKRADRIFARYRSTLYIFSAGNSGQDNDVRHHFPSRVRRDHVMSVAALNGDLLASFSNWGANNVDIAAPGVGVLSIVPTVYAQQTGLSQTPASGTSMAAPHVANLAARCLQLNPHLTGAELKRILMETGEPNISLLGKIVSGKAVHGERALKAAQFSREMPLDEALKLALTPVVLTNSSSVFSSPTDLTIKTQDTLVPQPAVVPSAPPTPPQAPTSPAP